MRICIVGAGAAGICAGIRLMQMKNFGTDCVIKIFEQSNMLGGTWVYTDNPNAHSSMYDTLRTNIPKEVMSFQDLPFQSCDFNDPDEYWQGQSYPLQKDVLSYLKRIAQPINHLIHLNKSVVSINHDKSQGDWLVEIQDLSTFQKSIEIFDVIFVCTGHYHSPRLPTFVSKLTKIPWMHSHSYRTAKPFEGKSVAVIGAKLSGVEIAQQIQPISKKVFLIHKRSYDQPNILWNEDFHPYKNNYEECCYAIGARSDAILLVDGRVLDAKEVDVIVFCTGYRYCFPFFDNQQNEGLNDAKIIECPNDGDFVQDLFAHIASAKHLHSLFFIGLNTRILPFPAFDIQCHFAIALMNDKIPKSKLPSSEDIKNAENARIEKLQSAGLPLKLFHDLGPEQWTYYEWLIEMMSLNNDCPNYLKNYLRPVIRLLYEDSNDNRSRHPANYRFNCYKIIDDERFEVSRTKF